MDIEIIRRICLSRHLYELGKGCLKSGDDVHLFSAVNLLQDAVEAFLLAVADFVDAPLKEKAPFDQYFVAIDGAIDSGALPFKPRLLRLNRLRVGSKHHGIQPDRGECNRLYLVAREFFEQVSTSILHVPFSTVSTIDLLRDGDAKDHLLAAKSAMEQKNYGTASIECRKAIYVEIESGYDIVDFKSGEKPRGLFGPFSKAPMYAKNDGFIKKSVKDPTDYIVYDHNYLDQELLKYSVDTNSFWNIWRLTPEVYRTKDKDWVVKQDFAKLDEESVTENIDYIFTATADILLAIHTKKSHTKSSSHQLYHIDLASEEVPVYEKADKNSTVACITPQGMNRINCNYSITGLNGDGPYWHVTNLDKRGFFSGFIHNENTK